jgi:hypothetical protein
MMVDLAIGRERPMSITRRSTLGTALAALSLRSAPGVAQAKPFDGKEIKVLVVRSSQFEAQARRVAMFTERTGINVTFVDVPFPTMREKLTAERVGGSSATLEDGVFVGDGIRVPGAGEGTRPDMVLGVRPEDLILAEGEAHFTGSVYSSELTGEAVTATVDPARTYLFDHQTAARVRGNAPPGFAS